MAQRVHIETVGCQMNALDSEMVVASLRRIGYDLADRPEQADIILFNTCSVRQHAEDKVYSALGTLRRLKREHPDRIIGVLGCMAQKDQRRIFERAPYVDLVVGPGQLHQVPALIAQIREGRRRRMAVSLDRKAGTREAIRRSHETFDPLRDPAMRPNPFQAYLRIQIGCDKFCTYCVVPMTRGPEQGRSPSEIIEEARILADQGCVEITFLGQTVNSYRYTEGDRTWRLADLLEAVHEIEPLRRLKFVTNYPLDMTEDLLRTVGRLPRCSPYLHVPLQSGSDAVLARMRRGYTLADYEAMMERIDRYLPQAAVASDFIVGFCGETEEEFEETMAAVRRYRFKNSFIFKYSERPGTSAARRLPDDVPRAVKERRHAALLALQNAISEEENQAFVGNVVEVLVEGPSKRAQRSGESSSTTQLVGRTLCDRIVVFDGPLSLRGSFVRVVVYDVNAHTLFAERAPAEACDEPLVLDTIQPITTSPAGDR